MSDSDQSVQLSFRHTEQEYLAAVRYYVWNSKELLLRIIIVYVLASTGMVLLLQLFGSPLPLWVVISFVVLTGVALFQGYLVDLPRRYFRGDPKFRDEYALTFTDAGIEFRTTYLNASLRGACTQLQSRTIASTSWSTVKAFTHFRSFPKGLLPMLDKRQHSVSCCVVMSIII